MVIWNVLEDLRRRENARRGYHEVRTPQLYDSDLWRTSALEVRADLRGCSAEPRGHPPDRRVLSRDPNEPGAPNFWP